MRRYIVVRLGAQDSTTLLQSLLREFTELSGVVNANTELQQEVLNVAPTKPRIGQLAYADGVNWNPGAGGEGTYEYRSGGWTKLGP